MNGSRGGLRVGLVGLGFGAEFIPIYLHHPAVKELWICDPDSTVLASAGERFGIEQRLSSFDELLRQDLDAVHLVTPIPLHARQTLAVLESGNHCACTVPMATSLSDLRGILDAKRRSRKSYMAMETAVYTREFLFVRDMAERGEFGRLQFLRGAHYQDMENWPSYWLGLPPMYYATHAIAPLFLLAKSRAVEVHCYGSGRMRAELERPYQNPFPVETAIFRLERNGLAAEVTRSLFHTAHAYTESFNVYGEKACFEWQQIEEEEPVVSVIREAESDRGRPVDVKRVQVPDRQELLPEPIRRFTQRGVYDETNADRSFLQGGGHGGSHPHLVNEFLGSIVEGREPVLNARVAAEICAAGICAHESAMGEGKAVAIPAFS